MWTKLKRLHDDITYSYNYNRCLFLKKAAFGIGVSMMGCLMMVNQQPAPAEEVQYAWVQVALVVLAIGLSYLASKLLAPKEGPIKNDKPTTLSTRGSYINWFMGVRRVGPVFCWVGESEVRKEEVCGAGKDIFTGGTPEQDVFHEAGWHVLAVGPVECLHQIIQGGEVIFNGPISKDSHPSGSTVDLGAEGSFTIYWGEESQPINAFLGNANRVGISSRWPHVCYVVWNKKRLGPSHNWPLLDYVLERRPSQALLTQSDGWYPPINTLSGISFDVFDAFASGVPGAGYLEFEGDLTSFFKPKSAVEITGNGIGDGTYEILKSETILVDSGFTLGGYPIKVVHTLLFLTTGTFGADDQGSVETYVDDDSDGPNIAHVIAELLFADFPQGLQIDFNHFVEKWDLESLEALGVEAETDSWRASVLGADGENAEALLGNMLQDHGVLLTINTVTGNLYFYPVREPSSTLPALSSNIYANQLPEITSIHGEQPVDRLIYIFSDRSHQFGDMTIQVDEDGQASYLDHHRARRVPITSTVHFDTAAKLSELRSPEELAHSAEFNLDAGREARDLIPGDAITADGFDEVLRVVSVQIDPLDERVKVKVLPDFYGARKSDFITGEGGGEIDIADPAQDLQFFWMEVPEQVLGSFPSAQTILVPRIRAHDMMSFSSLWLSRDDVTYTLFGIDTLVQTGGTLDEALPADGPSYLDQGPEYTELGPDNSTLTQDLSADLPNWGLGRQLCILVTAGEVEVCFLQRATIVSGSTRRLDGLLRARYDTRKIAHGVGTQVYIFDRDAITPVQDILLEPDVDLYVKSQPGSSGGQVNLSAVPPFGELLHGKGQVPIQPDYVHVLAPFRSVPAFQTGNDITIAWALSTGTPGTGAGGQAAGVAIAAPDIPGTLLIELLTTGDTLQASVNVSAEDVQYTITNAALVAAFSGEPSAFKVRITHAANGRSSDVSPSTLITKVA